MRRSLVSSSESRRQPKSAGRRWTSLGTPLNFIVTGFTWLIASLLPGMALILGLVYGTPLPRWLRPLHVHGALVGGILQLAIGGLLVFIAYSSNRKDASAQTRRALFLAWNAGTAVLLLGFWLENMPIVGVAGLLLSVAVLSFSKTAWVYFGHALGVGWMYRIALAALLGGLAAGIAMAFRLTNGYYAHARLAHVHLIVLGCLTLSFIVVCYQFLPLLLRTPPAGMATARFALWVLPAGFAVLLAGFLTSAVWLQLAVGWLLLFSIALIFFHLVRSWLRAGSPGTAATDHLLIGAFFLLVATAAGLAMGTNYLSYPPFLPIGSLHMVAYTHLAFIGFLTQMVCGGLSYVMPDLLATTRVHNHSKQESYRMQLDGIMNRWRTVQLAGLSLGTIALPVLAALTWIVPLGSAYVQSAAWLATGLLFASLTLFAVKLARAVALQPS
jgi:hypothetical protein